MLVPMYGMFPNEHYPKMPRPFSVFKLNLNSGYHVKKYVEGTLYCVCDNYVVKNSVSIKYSDSHFDISPKINDI